jgi:hypothetical protein
VGECLRSGQPVNSCQCLESSGGFQDLFPPAEEVYAMCTVFPRKTWQEKLGDVDFYFTVMPQQNSHSQ